MYDCIYWLLYNFSTFGLLFIYLIENYLYIYLMENVISFPTNKITSQPFVTGA